MSADGDSLIYDDGLISKQEHMQWCKDRALAYYDRGEKDSAIASFLSDVGTHPGTEHITNNGSMFMAKLCLQDGLGSRDQFAKAMKGFGI
jgi:hypothetical protein